MNDDHRRGPGHAPEGEPSARHADDDGSREGRRHGHGPEGTEFLDLEMSKVIYGDASRLAVEAARELLREAIKARLRERLGGRLAAVGRIAADELADDVEANLGIERAIAKRRRAKGSLDEKLSRALSADDAGVRGGGAGRGARGRADARASRSAERPPRSRSSR